MSAYKLIASESIALTETRRPSTVSKESELSPEENVKPRNTIKSTSSKGIRFGRGKLHNLKLEATRLRDDHVRGSSIRHLSWSALSNQLKPAHWWPALLCDLKNGQLIQFHQRFFILVLLCGVMVLPLLPFVFILSGVLILQQASYGTACAPDGSFNISGYGYSPWTPTSAFDINVAFGSLSFGQSKLIDVSWDVVVGRGGQAIVAFYSYHVFTKALTRVMESSTIDIRTFEALALQCNTGWGTMKLAWYLPRTTGWRARFVTVWIILCGIFVICLPTWLAAMTGYTAEIKPYIVVDTDGSVNAADFLPLIYTIHDGSRLGTDFHDDFKVTVPWMDEDSVALSISNRYSCSRNAGYYTDFYTSRFSNSNKGSNVTFQWQDNMSKECSIMWHTSLYVSEYGLLGFHNSPSTFVQLNNTNTTLTSPGLNITAHLTDEFPSYYDVDWYNRPSGLNWTKPGSSEPGYSQPAFYNGKISRTFDFKEMNDRGTCRAREGIIRYRWGFSLLLLFIFEMIWLTWIIVISAIYLDAFLHSRLNIGGRNIGLERAVLDLSTAMQHGIDDRDKDKMLGNGEIAKAVSKTRMTYATLSYDSIPLSRWIEFQLKFKQFDWQNWLRLELWWLILLFFAILFFILSVAGPYDFQKGWSCWFSFMPILGIIGVLLQGRDTKGRWTVFAFWFIIFAILNIWWSTWYS